MDYVAITGRNESSCGYCHAPSESSISFGLWAYSLRCDTYQRLLDRGWRRSGKYLYKPELAETCCSLVTIRLDVAKYALSRGQKKVVKKMRRFIAEGKRPGKYGADVGQDGEDATQDMDVDSSGPSGGEKQEFPTREPPQFSDASRLRDQEASVPITKSKMYPPQSAQHIPNPDTKGGGPQPSSTERPGSSSQPVLGGGQLPPSKSKPKPKPPPPTDILSLISQTEEPTSHPGSQTLKVVLERAAFNDEVFQLYSKYQIAVHHDPPHKLTPSAFKRFLVDSPLVFEPPTPTTPGYGTFHQKYYLNNRLVAVGVLDILPNCISSVYLMYDPDISFLSMGTYSAIREIALTVKLRKELPQLKYYYMGYYVQTCPKMRYKANYKPSEILCPVKPFGTGMSGDFLLM
ncbi:arginine-tRNA-protein transferase [Phlyctochytrium arcticum]|nr:arginine-tRNA-protein transferase [Phlyctochytrium arcticum]